MSGAGTEDGPAPGRPGQEVGPGRTSRALQAEGACTGDGGRELGDARRGSSASTGAEDDGARRVDGDALRGLPSVHALLELAEMEQAIQRGGRELTTAAVREAIQSARDRARSGAGLQSAGEIAAAAREALDSLLAPRPRPLINATGVLLHTNLGRAPVSASTADAMAAASRGYSDLEYDLASGARGSRHDLAVPLLRRLTGAEACLVVNNNAGATLLVLSALAAGRGVVVSRGQLVEIGGGYRIPDVMAAGGARLVEVGTTNRTHPRDYAAAIDDDIALLLRVHTSNYRVVGFACEVPLETMVDIGQRHGVPVVDDLGSGSLLDTSAFGLAPEPMVQASIAAGADLVTFSGDKLLGGPQAGIVVGRADLVERLRSHPLTRALRPDKATLAGLAETLRHYAKGEAAERVPIWRMIAATQESLRQRAGAWLDPASASAAQLRIELRLVDGESAVGGGSLPGTALPSVLLAIGGGPAFEAGRLAALLRAGETPVVGRVADGELLLDPRTVDPVDDAVVARSLAAALDRVAAAAPSAATSATVLGPGQGADRDREGG